ncbi:ABC transporter family substrate-binding protein [Amycolatopsis jejuensis]|uniref:ABC transporter family substrate-binding protein n=1 Tax=Amycolatopsis jejuensis TaxID=330084 RepID=UPI000526B6EC|nr:ABC transporter family substrate-binding protein [Amycolatopsis jejuensis]
MKKWLAGVCAVTTSLTMVACGSGGSPAAGRTSIVVADTSGIRDWNPLSATGDTTIQRQQQWPLYPHPFLPQADTSLKLNDALLASAAITSTSPMVVTYKIKDQAKWSDGTPITAADFEYTWSVQNPKVCKECKAAFTEGYTLISKVVAQDGGKTAEVHFDKPFSQWQSLFTFLLPAHVAKQYGSMAQSFNDGFTKNQPKVTGGPYQVKEYQPGVSLTLSRNEAWYGTKTGYETVVFREIKSVDEQLTALRNGEIDVMSAAPSVDTIEQLKGMAKVETRVGPSLTYQHLGIQTSGGPLRDPDLRKAVATALDLNGIRARTLTPVAPNVPAMNSAVYVPGQNIDGIEAYHDNLAAVGVGRGDLAAAKQILAGKGYTQNNGALRGPGGADIPPLVFVTEAANSSRVETAQIVQQQLAPLGLKVAIQSLDANRYASTIFDGKFDLMVTGTALDLGPISVQQWYGSDGGRNFGYHNARVDELFATAYAATDPATLVKAMNDVDKILLADLVVLPLFPAPRMIVYPKGVTGIELNPSKYGITVNVENWAGAQ